MPQKTPTGPDRDLWDELGHRVPKLYGWRDLYAGATDEVGYKHERSFKYRVYREYVTYGQPDEAERSVFYAQSSHDAAIGFALRELLRERRAVQTTGKKTSKGVVAIMGGHSLSRKAPIYAEVVWLARELTQNGFLIATGGGPGAMEAAHLGALTANFHKTEVEAWIKKMATSPVPDFPSGLHNLNKRLQCKLDVSELLELLDAWIAPAFEVRTEITKADPNDVETGMSLSIPTWHYGHEPPTPFASHIAKFFQNSIREDKLLAHAQSGIVYVQGSAGTIQEIFQDAAQNYYTSFQYFSPMVFFDLDANYWTQARPVKPLMDSLFASAKGELEQDFKTFVAYITRREEIIALIEAFKRTVPDRIKNANC